MLTCSAREHCSLRERNLGCSQKWRRETSFRFDGRGVSRVLESTSLLIGWTANMLTYRIAYIWILFRGPASSHIGQDLRRSIL